MNGEAVKPIVIPYLPRTIFRPFHERKARWACIVAHRRAGKTVATVNDLIRGAVRDNKPDGRYGYVAPHLNQVKDLAWTYLKQYAAPLLAEAPNETELRVDLVNGARIRLYGGDNPDRLRGIYLDGAVLDEFADMPPAVWHEVVRPALSDRKGWAIFIGTPKGRNAFYDLCYGGGSKEWAGAASSPDWFFALLKASRTGVIDPAELQDARVQMGEERYEQEYECSFDAAVHGAFYAEAMREAMRADRVGKVPIDKEIKVHTAWDLGVSDSTAIWFIQCVARERRLVDYYETSGVGLAHYARVLEEKKSEHGWFYANHWFPHDIEQRELSSGQSRVETLRSLGIEPTVVPVHNVLDGVNAVRRMLERTWVDEVRCLRGLDALRQYRREWDDRLKDWKANALHDWSSHGADALRTFAAGFDDPKAVERVVDRHRKQAGHMGEQSGPWSA